MFKKELNRKVEMDEVEKNKIKFLEEILSIRKLLSEIKHPEKVGLDEVKKIIADIVCPKEKEVNSVLVYQKDQNGHLKRQSEALDLMGKRLASIEKELSAEQRVEEKLERIKENRLNNKKFVLAIVSCSMFVVLTTIGIYFNYKREARSTSEQLVKIIDYINENNVSKLKKYGD
ncbi:MAG: hypothetical protein GY821_12715 [Gammaproteobacteria bacterium]|nr:hypothetical protein [Gammaproteobacteria bacterium]